MILILILVTVAVIAVGTLVQILIMHPDNGGDEL